MDHSKSKHNKLLIGTSRGKFIVSLIPKTGVQSDGEESDSEKLSDEAFLEKLHKNFEGVADLLNEVEVGDDDENYEYMESSYVNNQCDPCPQESIATIERTPEEKNTSLKTCLSGERVTRGEKRKREARRPNTPPMLPVPEANTIKGPRVLEAREKGAVVVEPQPSTSRNQVQSRRSLPFTTAKGGSKSKKPTKITFRWKKKDFSRGVTLPETKKQRNVPLCGSSEYFRQFFTDDLIGYIVEQTKLYSTQETQGKKSIMLNKFDIMDFLAIHILMGVVKMNSYRDYWSADIGYERVSSIMSRNRYEEIRSYLHFANNEEDLLNDRFYKIRPLFEYLRNKFIEFDGREKKYAIDEMMIKYKGKKAGSRKQYMPKKPIKWGFKIFGRSGVSGFIYDMVIYSGLDTLQNYVFPFSDQSLTFSGQIVAALCQTIPDPPLSAIFIDNWFNSPNLMYILRKHFGILSLGTLRSDRTAGAADHFSTDRALAAKGRGSFEVVSDNARRLCVVKWADTKTVMLGSSYVGALPVGRVRRFSREENKKVPIPCPALVKEYNQFMGGVDKSDMLISIFKTPLKSFKWYMNIFSWLIDVSLCNAWILYREDHPDSKMGLKKFKIEVADGLVYRSRPRNFRKTKKTHKAGPLMPDEIKYDKTDHFPGSISKGKCRHCHTGQTVWSCQKCKLRLCLNTKKNCFVTYHLPPGEQNQT